MILVTGGTGLLGSRLLYDLTSRGKKVRAIKRKTSSLDPVRRIFSYFSDSPGELLFRIEWIDADILDIDSLLEAMGNVSYVYHSAGYVSFDPDEKEKVLKINIDGTRNVVNACLANSVKKLCHVSSTSALGLPDPDGITREKSFWSPEKDNSIYSLSKYRSELEVWRGIEEGLQAVIVNPSVILGPGFWQKGSSRMFSAIHQGLKFYTSGVTGFVSVEDVSTAMIALMNSHYSGERFNLSSENRSYKEVLSMIAKSLDKKPPSIEITPALGKVAWRIEHLKKFLGGKRLLSSEIISASFRKTYISKEKFTNAFNAEFVPVETAIMNIGKLFRKDLEDGWLDRKSRTWNKPDKFPGAGKK